MHTGRGKMLCSFLADDVCSRHLMLLVWPRPLCCDWSYGSIPLVEEFADLRSLLPFCIVYALPAGLLVLASTSAGSLGEQFVATGGQEICGRFFQVLIEE